MEPPRWREEPDRQVLRRAFFIAAETGERCRPIHLLAALAYMPGPIAAVLRPPNGGPLWGRSKSPLPVHGGSGGYLVGQAQAAASAFASERGDARSAEHLLLAVIDQGEPEAMDLLARAGLDLATLRGQVLAILGAPPDLPRLPMPPLPPAGTLDRPPLPVEDLDPRAWEALRWRQERLPLQQLRRRSRYEALGSLEDRAAWRVASRLELDNDQRYSLVVHHHARVKRPAAAVLPDPRRSP